VPPKVPPRSNQRFLPLLRRDHRRGRPQRLLTATRRGSIAERQAADCRMCRAGERSGCDGGRSATGPAQTVVDPPRPGPDGGRSADISPACRVGASTTVWVSRRRRPIRHRVEGGRGAVAVAHRPPSPRPTIRWPLYHRDTPRRRRQIDHRLRQSGADRPPSQKTRANRYTIIPGERAPAGQANHAPSGNEWSRSSPGRLGGSTNVTGSGGGVLHPSTRCGSEHHDVPTRINFSKHIVPGEPACIDVVRWVHGR